MTLDEVKALVSKFTYKPNSTFKVRPGYEASMFDGRSNLHIIEVSILCTDVNDHTKQNFVANQTGFYLDDIGDWTEELVIFKIVNAIRSIEDHENAEWLRLDGKFVRDPHPEIKHGKNYLRRKT